METSNFISKKIDKKNHFVFLKAPKEFLIVDDLYVTLFNQFYSLSEENLKKNISKTFSSNNANDIYLELKELLKNTDLKKTQIKDKYKIPDNLKSFKFKLGVEFFTIYYDDLDIVNTVIGQLFHMENNSVDKSKNYYVFKHNKRYFLNNQNVNIGSWKKDEIHYLTGKLLSLIMCDFHKIVEEKWSGFLHASAVSISSNAYVIVGESGNGKSTSSAILSKNGFELLSDDITPVSRDGKIANFPNSISIKEPSFTKIQGLYNDEKLSDAISISKGKIKYLNTHKSSTFNPVTLSCSNIIWIKYDKDSDNSLKELELKEILPLIVNESFFPINSKSVKGFMSWFVKCTCYEIIYNNDDSLIDFFNTISKK